MSGSPAGVASLVARWVRRLSFGLVAVVLLYQMWLFGWVVLWNWVNPDMTRFMEIRLAELQAKDSRAQLKKQWVDYGKISIHLKRALIVAEDDLFTQHDGFDWDGIQRAMERNQRRGRLLPAARPFPSNWLRTSFCRRRKRPGVKLRRRSSPW